MKKLFSIFLLLFALPAFAVDRVTVTVTVTNTPANGDTLTLNADVRTWKPSATNTSSEITIGASIGANATNLFNAIAASPFVGSVILSRSGTNGVVLTGQAGSAMAASLAGTWGYLTLSTQVVTTLTAVRVPVSGEPSATTRTNVANGLVDAINDYTANTFDTAAPALANFVNTTTTQTVSNKTLTLGVFDAGNITNSTVKTLLVPYVTDAESGIEFFDEFGNRTSTISTDRNGLPSLYGTLLNPIPTNAFGAYTPSPENILIRAAGDTYYGRLTSANSWTGTNSFAQITNAVIVGSAISASTIGGTISTLSSGTVDGSVITNATVYGTARFTAGGGSSLFLTNATTKAAFDIGGDLAFQRYDHTALAAGANASINFGTNVFVKITSGPTNDFSVNGVANGRNGKTFEVWNYTAYTLTVAHESGLEATPANRIVTPTLSDFTVPAKAGFALKYDTGASRWIANPLLYTTGGTGTVSSIGMTVPTGFAVSPLTITGAGVFAITRTAPVTIADGGTGQSTKPSAFNALSPLTTRGDIVYHDGINGVRLPLGSAGKVLLSDGTDLVYNYLSSTNLTGTGTALTAGSVPFVGSTGMLAQDNAHLYFDDTNDRLGVGIVPLVPLHVLNVNAPQFRVAYSAGQYLNVSVSSGGVAQFDPTGLSTVFSGAVHSSDDFLGDASTSSHRAGLLGYFYVNGSSRWSSPTNGMWVAQNNAASDYADLLARNYYVSNVIFRDTTVQLPVSAGNALYALEGVEMNIYYRDVIHSIAPDPLEDYYVKVVCTKGSPYKEYWRYTPTAPDAGSTTFNLYVYTKDGTVLVASASATLITRQQAYPSSPVTRSAIVIGDSTGAAPLAELVRMFSTDTNYTLTLKGSNTGTDLDSTGTSRSIACDAISGWSYSRFDTNTATAWTTIGGAGRTGSPFVRTAGTSFDFNYYLTNYSITLSSNDWVILNLGINDCFFDVSDTAAIAQAATCSAIISRWVTNIQATASGVRIAVCLPISANPHQDAWGQYANPGYEYTRYDRNHDFFVARLLADFDAASVSGVCIFALNGVVDTVNNMRTTDEAVNARNPYVRTRYSDALHPANSGSWQISDAYRAFLKGRE